MTREQRYFFTDEQLRIAVAKTHSMAGLLRELQVNIAGSRYPSTWKRINELGLDTSHWTGQGYLKGKSNPNPNRKPLADIMVENSDYSAGKLKARLIREGILPNRCSNPKCQVATAWLGEPLVLVLDHINGNHNDNRLGNLRLLCPNCNSQTPTFCSRKLAVNRTPPSCQDCGNPVYQYGNRCTSCAALHRYNSGIHTGKCKDCGQSISLQSLRCRHCAGKLQPTKIQWPTLDALLHRLKISSCVAVAKELGVSDKAVVKHIRMEQRKLTEKSKS